MDDLSTQLLVFAEQLPPELRDQLLELVDRSRLHETSQTWVPVEEGAPQVVSLDLPSRYEDLGLLGKGGMGEVRRVRDRQLRREVAMKILRRSDGQTHSYSRFVAEAQTMGQLEHPGVVPVYDLGTLPDGRPYFVMQEVRGATLADTLRRVHDGRGGGWTLRGLLRAFQDVCATMAYAHARGVVHRDLKPANILLGAFGEVLVVDWGLTKVTGEHGDADTVDTLRSQSGDYTVIGRIAGTPRYMAPEQAHGHIAAVGPHTDVFALGLVLHEILCGKSPYRAKTLQQLQAEVLVVRDRIFEDSQPPDALRTLVEDCLAPSTDERLAHAGLVEERVREWLDGAKRRDEALELVADGLARLPRSMQLARQARRMADEAAQSLEQIPTWAPSEEKRSAWQLQDEAARLARKAELERSQALNRLEAALAKEPALDEAHDALADYYHQVHRDAEARGDLAESEKAEWRLRAHGAQRYGAYLEGRSELQLALSHPVPVRAWRVVERDRRLVTEDPRELGTTPLSVTLEAGSWLLEWNNGAARYPVFLERGQAWHAPPGVVVAARADIPAGWCWVPAGYSWYGSDRPADQEATVPRQQVWCHGFLIQELPVTHGDYLRFLQSLTDQGLGDEAVRWAPRERAAREGMLGELLYHFEAGVWSLTEDRLGEVVRPDGPVVQVDVECASAYARWLGQAMGRDVRLPSEWEWERAARGADGRLYPMGNHIDGSWANYWDSHQAGPKHRPVGHFRTDRSPFGVRDLAGGAMCWCLEGWRQPLEVRQGQVRLVQRLGQRDRVIRGGHYATRDPLCAIRHLAPPNYRGRGLGIRLVIPLDDAPELEYE